MYEQFGFRIPPKGEKAPRPTYEPGAKEDRLALARPEYDKFIRSWEKKSRQEKRSCKCGRKASASVRSVDSEPEV